MKKKFEVRWYEFNLTNERTVSFYTEIAACLFYLWLRFVKKEKPTIYEY